MTQGVFISYRHDDSEGEARAIYDRLRDRLEREVILDVEHREPGRSYVEKIERAIAGCKEVLVIIGPDWLASGPSGRRRIDDPDDTVRFEVATALRHHRTDDVIPVLVRRAQMPRSGDLPSDIEALSKREAMELTNTRFEYDMDLLVARLGGSARVTKLPLKDVAEGSWVVEIHLATGQVQLMQLDLEKHMLGRRQFHASSKMGPPWTAQGTWEVLREGELVLRGTQLMQYPFPQSGPYEAYVKFSNVTRDHLDGATFAGETITWQRASR